ncbi:PAN2-PAN3 deadenylation complex subunit pan3-like [Watersipora subatra]|uniref:PAN2-PAN3 deadenylation complex subunit pan3-like n=1 Tax=Watersipora subatra TaxID=2589382 RepID=UPI00355C4292
MSYNFSPSPVLPHGSNAIGSTIAQLAINTSPLLSQSDLSTAAHEFVPKSGPLNRGIVPAAPQLSRSAGPGKSVYSFSRSQPNFAPGSPQAGRGRSKIQTSPTSHISPNHLPHSVDTSAPFQHRRHRTDASHGTLQTMSTQAELLQMEETLGTTYFYPQEDPIQPALRQTFHNCSAYVGAPTHLAHMKQSAEVSGLFLNDDIKASLLERQGAILAEVEGYSDLPAEVDSYCRLVPLEATPSELRDNYNYTCSTYKAVNRKNGLTYCLQRIHAFKLTSQSMDTIGKWKDIASHGVVQLRQVFTTKAFGDNSLVFVYDFHPCSEVMISKHLNNALRSSASNGYSNPYNVNGAARPFSAGKAGSRKAIRGQVAETTLWTYAVQLINALRTIHHHNLSANGLSSNSILLTYKDRLRINRLGMLDVIAYDPKLVNSPLTIQHLQKKDLQSLGLILLALSCNSHLAFRPEHLSQSLSILSSTSYSLAFIKLVKCLLSAVDLLSGSTSTLQVDDLLPLVSAQLFTELNSQLVRYDVLESELSKSVENGRLFRLQAKLNTILERADLNMDGQWSETGDRYILKLFRDYVYHQTGENGAPWVDMAHVVTALNKLDAGVQEKLCLTSSDETAVIVVSYAELKRCYESAFGDILEANFTTYN